MRTDKINIIIKKHMNKTVKIIVIKCLYPFRNSFLLLNLSNKARKDIVNLNYWDESKNLGDSISPVVVNYLLGRDINDVNITTKKAMHLYAIGSVITAGIQDATIWGSGILNPNLLYRLKNRKFDVRSVRGPITRSLLMDFGIDTPEVYGDPAIFLPEIYKPDNTLFKSKYGIIMHKDFALDEKAFGDLTDYKIIDICTDNYKQFIDEINSVEIVVSSSLHGIIIAESYGIPALLFKPKVDFMKYYDYYFSTARFDIPMISNFNEIEKTKIPNVPEFNEMKIKLREAFPYDIFN